MNSRTPRNRQPVRRTGRRRTAVRIGNQRRTAVTPYATLKRKCIQQRVVTLNNSLETGANTYADCLQFNATTFVGVNTCLLTFEYYRINRVRIYAMPAMPTALSNTQADVFRSPLISAATTVVYCAPDWTPNETAATTVRCYNNSSSHTLSTTHMKKIADFAPRVALTRLSPQIIRPAGAWVSSTELDVTYNGLQIYITNPGGANSVWSSPTYQQQVQLQIEIDIEFKQPALQIAPTLADETEHEPPDVVACDGK